MNQAIDFIVNDVAFKVNQEMALNSTDDLDLFMDKSHFKLKILSFIIFKTANPAETCTCDYKPDDETLNYFISLSNEERSGIEQRILNKIKGIEVSSAPDLSTMGVEIISEFNPAKVIK